MGHDDTIWLTGLENDRLTCVRERWDILAYALEHRRPNGEWPSNAEVTAAVLSLVESGWIEVHRLVPSAAPDDPVR